MDQVQSELEDKVEMDTESKDEEEEEEDEDAEDGEGVYVHTRLQFIVFEEHTLTGRLRSYVVEKVIDHQWQGKKACLITVESWTKVDE